MDSGFFEEARRFLPKYLNPDQTKDLYEGLKSFPEGFEYYLPSGSFAENFLQGDGWRGFTALNFETLEKKHPVSGLIISNSCDIDPANRRDHPPNVLFAPLIRLSKYEELLAHGGQTPEQIASKVADIKRQHVTSIFFFPGIEGAINDSLILLDDIHRQPLKSFQTAEKSKLFTLSQQGFYLFLMKISIHFCRFNEGIPRFVS